MKGFTWIDMVVLVVYLGAVLLAGLAFSKKEMKGKEFFKGDGTIPWWVTSVSIFATLLSPISFLSLAGNNRSPRSRLAVSSEAITHSRSRATFLRHYPAAPNRCWPGKPQRPPPREQHAKYQV